MREQQKTLYLRTTSQCVFESGINHLCFVDPLHMTHIVDFPRLVFALTLVGQWLTAHLGAFVGNRLRPLEETERPDFAIVLAATLTLLGLIIGFGFSMVVSRYDQRKNYEEEEANAVGTEYLRAGLLPDTEAAKVRELLKNYLDQRLLFYESQDAHQLERVALHTSQLQAELWSVVQATATKQPTPTIALAVSGINDVLNSQGYTQAAWLNRLPIAAWWLVLAIAIFCNLLIGYSAHTRSKSLLLVLPLAVSTSFFLIADIDSPRHGLIRLVPVNLMSLSESLRSK